MVHQNSNWHLKGILIEICNNDVDTLEQKDQAYGSSWKKRGGVGAFMMLARKWDRIENMTKEDGWDIFQTIIRTAISPVDNPIINPPEPLLETIQDLRRYLLLVESEMKIRAQNRDTVTVSEIGGPDREIEIHPCDLSGTRTGRICSDKPLEEIPQKRRPEPGF